MTGPTSTLMRNRGRREFLAGCCCVAAAGLGMPGRRTSAQGDGADPVLTFLDDGLAQITGAGGNIVVLDGPGGLLLVDTGERSRSGAVRSLLNEHFPGKAVDTIINTHWHLGHTGGNEEFGDEAREIIAHENTRLWMSTTFYVEWQDERYFPRPAAAVPNTTFFSSDPQPLELEFGGQRIVYALLEQAHTDGDIYVWLPQRNVIVAGGTVTAGRYPVMDYITGGWIGGLTEATEFLIDLADSDTRIVPAAGAPVGRAELEDQNAMLMTVRERIEAIALEGRGIDDMIAARITAEFDARYGDPEQFITNAYHGLWWNRMRGIVA